MNYTILNTIKEKPLKESTASEVEVITASNNNSDNLTDESVYGDALDTVSIEDKYGLEPYTLSTDYMMSLKEARRSKEIKTPFAIAKRQDRKSRPSEFDSIYRTYKKIKYSDYRQGIRLGFIQSSSVLKNTYINNKNSNKFIGIANQDIPIRKKKGFNQKKLGYIKLQEGTDTQDYYVEITQNRGILWMILTFLITATLVVLLHNINWNNWHIDWRNLTAFRSTISEFTEQSSMSIYHQSKARLDGSTLRLELTSDHVDGQKYKIKIYLGAPSAETLVYEGKQLEAGASIPSIELNNIGHLEPGTYNCVIVCDVYKSTGRYLGALESTFTLEV